ncbi:MAG: hypothetical protein ABF479_11080 [Gluconacetobacter sp.]
MHTPLTQIKSCTRRMRDAARLAHACAGPVTLSADEHRELGDFLMRLAIDIEGAVGAAVVDHTLTRMDLTITDVDYVEVRS